MLLLTSSLARILRTLATHHIFREVAPDYFKTNMISSVLDTGKNVADIQRECVFLSCYPLHLSDYEIYSPVTKFDNTNGVAAFASLL